MLKQILIGLCLILLVGCPQKQPLEPKVPEKPTSPQTFQPVHPGDYPSFGDDMDKQSMIAAIEKSLSFYNRIPADRTYHLGERTVTVQVLKETLTKFLELLHEDRLDAATIADHFDVYRANSSDTSSTGLITGYYEPVLQGRLLPDDEFRYPLYGMPPDILTIDLASFDPVRYAGRQIVARLAKGRVVPYYTRSEIDIDGALEQFDCQLMWLNDPIGRFFLHIQGSGMIQLPDGKFVRFGYAGVNGRPYKSIGNYLIQQGLMEQKDVSLQTLRTFLQNHPSLIDKVLCHNESYVFFRKVDEGPVGSLNVTLTPGRSIATDPSLHPRGGLAFLESQKPVLNASGEVLRWEPMRRWVVNQDTGGAIKGAGRVDLFCGTGEAAEWIAGRLKHPGELYFLVKREKVE
jgi:membrane-bound lytic murein transglycosylase A